MVEFHLTHSTLHCATTGTVRQTVPGVCASFLFRLLLLLIFPFSFSISPPPAHFSLLLFYCFSYCSSFFPSFLFLLLLLIFSHRPPPFLFIFLLLLPIFYFSSSCSFFPSFLFLLLLTFLLSFSCSFFSSFQNTFPVPFFVFFFSLFSFCIFFFSSLPAPTPLFLLHLNLFVGHFRPFSGSWPSRSFSPKRLSKYSDYGWQIVSNSEEGHGLLDSVKAVQCALSDTKETQTFSVAIVCAELWLEPQTYGLRSRGVSYVTL